MPPPEPRSSTVSPSLNLRDRGRVAASERRQHSVFGQFAPLLGVVERLAHRRGFTLAVGAAAAAATAALVPLGHHKG